MISDSIKTEIMHRLRKTEEEQDVRILLAIESGSRAWGFESSNSDYDVRFIYIRNENWYLSIDVENRRDVIEYPIVDEIDLNGWDLRKALGLFYKSNPAFVEWLQSPITYIEQGCFRREALALLPKIYSVEQGIYHYKSMAKTNFYGHLQAEKVRFKKYFYVFRALLSIRYLEKNRKPAPIEFGQLLPLIENDTVLSILHELLEKKKSQMELAKIAPISELNQFIEMELKRLETLVPEKFVRQIEMAQLNTFFQQLLKQNKLVE